MHAVTLLMLLLIATAITAVCTHKVRLLRSEQAQLQLLLLLYASILSGQAPCVMTAHIYKQYSRLCSRFTD